MLLILLCNWGYGLLFPLLFMQNFSHNSDESHFGFGWLFGGIPSQDKSGRLYWVFLILSGHLQSSNYTRSHFGFGWLFGGIPSQDKSGRLYWVFLILSGQLQSSNYTSVWGSTSISPSALSISVWCSTCNVCPINNKTNTCLLWNAVAKYYAFTNLRWI